MSETRNALLLLHRRVKRINTRFSTISKYFISKPLFQFSSVNQIWNCLLQKWVVMCWLFKLATKLSSLVTFYLLLVWHLIATLMKINYGYGNQVEYDTENDYDCIIIWNSFQILIISNLLLLFLCSWLG